MQNRAWLGQVPLVQGYRPSVRRPALSGRFRLAGSPPALTDATFNQALSAPFAVVDFWSPSCPHCVTYKPVFEEASSQVGSGVLMVTANVDEAPKSAGTYNIQSIPATIFLANGKEVHRVEGGMSKQDLLAEVSRAFGGMPAPGSAAPESGGIPTWAGIAGGLAIAGLVAFLATR